MPSDYHASNSAGVRLETADGPLDNLVEAVDLLEQPPPAPLWEHRPGDTYRVAIGRAWCSQDPNGAGDRWGIDYNISATEHATPIAAVHEGFTEHDVSDDFNVVAYRHGRPVARLWMGQVVGTGQAEMAELAKATPG